MEDYRGTRKSEANLRNLDETAEDPFQSSSSLPEATAPQQPPHIHRPIPRRNFSNQSYTSYMSEPLPQASPPVLQNGNNRSSDFLAQLNARLLRTSQAATGSIQDGMDDGPLSKTKSFLNMKSTLFGIYDDVDSSSGGSGIADTPWGVGAETPSVTSGYDGSTGYENGLGSPDGGMRMKRVKRGLEEGQHRPPLSTRSSGNERKRRRNSIARYASITGKLWALFIFGACYGIIVSHLHDRRELAAVRVGGVDTQSWTYWASWGLAGIVLGTLLPYVDLATGREQEYRRARATAPKEAEPSLGELNEVVRSLVAFVGIGFAIRRLPWESTLQLTATLALVNPALWYILDRTRNGLFFSLFCTSIITSFIFLQNPDILPSPALPATTPTTTNATHSPSGTPHHQELFAGVISYANLVTATWVGSVVFCSCICFGGIGRRLALLDEWWGSR